ncbi:hypothetical protein MSPP1_002834 [Malassezia sp. CBS 17886]|nr:hypothetical protein MSPP1_002834 [Malassezia sp. CBS 17886]
MRLSQEEAQRCYDENAFVILSSIPRGTNVGMDLVVRKTDAFEGYKMVPPGMHVVTWRAPSGTGRGGGGGEHASALESSDEFEQGMRSALVLYVDARGVVARTYDAKDDAFISPAARGDVTLSAGRETDGSSLLISRENLQSLDHRLAAYAISAAPLWHSLTVHLNASRATVARVFHAASLRDVASCDSFTPIAAAEGGEGVPQSRPAVSDVSFSHGPGQTGASDVRDHPDMLVEGAASNSESTARDSSAGSDAAAPSPDQHQFTSTLGFTPFALRRSWPPEARGTERTRWSMDKTWLLRNVQGRAAAAEAEATCATGPLLREFELVFLLFLLAHNADALAHWTALVSLFCRAAACLGAPSMHEAHPCEWVASVPPDTVHPDLGAHVAFLTALRAQFDALPPAVWTDELAHVEGTFLNDLAQQRINIARALSASAQRGQADTTWRDKASPEMLVAAWRALARTAHERFGWHLDAELDEEAEADEGGEGEDAPVIVEGV